MSIGQSWAIGLFLRLLARALSAFVLLDVVEAEGEDLDDDLKEDFLPVFALINRFRVGFRHD